MLTDNIVCRRVDLVRACRRLPFFWPWHKQVQPAEQVVWTAVNERSTRQDLWSMQEPGFIVWKELF